MWLQICHFYLPNQWSQQDHMSDAPFPSCSSSRFSGDSSAVASLDPFVLMAVSIPPFVHFYPDYDHFWHSKSVFSDLKTLFDSHDHFHPMVSCGPAQKCKRYYIGPSCRQQFTPTFTNVITIAHVYVEFFAKTKNYIITTVLDLFEFYCIIKV